MLSILKIVPLYRGVAKQHRTKDLYVDRCERAVSALAADIVASGIDSEMGFDTLPHVCAISGVTLVES